VPPLERGVVLKVVAAVRSPGPKAFVSGETNLPDGTELMGDVSEPGDFGAAGGSDKTSVATGRFSFVPLGPDTGLPEGEYVANVLMPIPGVQPEIVQAVVGKEGQRLKGSLVKHGDIGTTVENTITFFVGSDPEKAKTVGLERRKATKAFLEEALRHYRIIVSRGRSANRGDPVACMRRARDDWDSLEPYNTKLEGMALTIAGVGSLRGAWLLVHNCASCASEFSRNCDDASQELREAAQSIAQGKVK
jgi:hypothetical protein